MYAVLIILVHAAISVAVALAIAPYSLDLAATPRSMGLVALASALISATGFAATAGYLSKRIRLFSGAQVGLLCGLLCGAMLGLVLRGIQFSLVLYLAIVVPALAAVMLASLLDRSKSGWQS